MSQISKLTKEQEDQIPRYVDKWIKIGLNTTPFTRKEATDIMKKVYKKIYQRETPPIIIMPSPLTTWLAVGLLSSKNIRQIESRVQSQVGAQVEFQVWDLVGAQVRAQVMAQVMDQVGDQVMDQVGAQVRAQVMDQVGAQVRAQVEFQVWDLVGAQVRAQVGDQVGAQVGDQVRAQVGAQVRDQVRAQVMDQVENFIYPYQDGSFMSSWFSFYDFFENVCGIKLNDKYHIWLETSKLSLCYPLNNFCVLCQHPTEIHIHNGHLHNDTDMSIKYSDGWGIYSLQGVRVPGKTKYFNIGGSMAVKIYTNELKGGNNVGR